MGCATVLPCLHYIVERPDRNSTKRPRNFPATAQFPPNRSMWVLEPFRFADACAERACYDAIPMSDAQEKPNRPRGHRIALDLLAKSASRTQPAFVAKPEGAPIYHGFPILSIIVEGFTFGKISDFDAEPCTEGDAFVVAPDNSRAGLVWEVSGNSYFREACPADSKRWRVWAVSFPHPMTNHENVQRNLEQILPQLKRRWQEWRDAQLRG